jgi:hypothetical protein
MTMMTYGITVVFQNSPEPIHISLDWLNNLEKDSLSSDFHLKDTHDDTGLMWLKGDINADTLLSYLGKTLDESRKRFPILEGFYQYRKKFNDKKAYAQIDDLEFFYKKLEEGEHIEKVSVNVIESY